METTFYIVIIKILLRFKSYYVVWKLSGIFSEKQAPDDV